MRRPYFNKEYTAQVEEYQKVGRRTWVEKDFTRSNLASSNALFTEDSLKKRSPVPKDLTVVALVAGLSFDQQTTGNLNKFQVDITAILGSKLYYWVRTENFGLEYFVFKWPEDYLASDRIIEISQFVGDYDFKPFSLFVSGFQINPDGCVLATGYDLDGNMHWTRSQLRERFPWAPVRQSRWFHIPLGRILEPVGQDAFLRLRELAEASARTSFDVPISKLLLVEEQRWYMEKRFTIASTQETPI